jgi:class 3 adenylate cyclase
VVSGPHGVSSRPVDLPRLQAQHFELLGADSEKGERFVMLGAGRAQEPWHGARPQGIISLNSLNSTKASRGSSVHGSSSMGRLSVASGLSAVGGLPSPQSSLSHSSVYADAAAEDAQVKKDLAAVRKLATFLPRELLSVLAESPGELQPAFHTGWRVVMLADISGFTRLSEALCAEGAEGVDKLSDLTSGFMGELIAIVHRYEGDIQAFAGDALIISWPGPLGVTLSSVEAQRTERFERTLRVFQCGLALSRVTQHGMTLHVGIASGPTTFFVLGDPDAIEGSAQWCTLLVGESVKRVGDAEGFAQSMQVVTCHTTFEPVASECYGVPIEGQDLVLLTGMRHEMPAPSPALLMAPETVIAAAAAAAAAAATFAPSAMPPSPTAVSAITAFAGGMTAAQLMPALRAFLPEPALEVLRANGQYLNEFRKRISVLFVMLEGFPVDIFDPCPDGPKLLQVFSKVLTELQRVLSMFNGLMRQFIVDDKGCVFVACFGVAGHTHRDDPTRAVNCGLAMTTAIKQRGMKAYIGLSTGAGFCGAVGSDARREYALVGRDINFAARLMSLAHKLARAKKLDTMLIVNSATQLEVKNESKFWLDPLEPVVLKGTPDPVQVYHARHAIETQTLRTDGEKRDKRIIGHDALLANILGLSLMGKPRFFVVEGEQGHGKSLLLHTLCATSEQAGASKTVLVRAINSKAPHALFGNLLWALIDLDGLRGADEGGGERDEAETEVAPEAHAAASKALIQGQNSSRSLLPQQQHQQQQQQQQQQEEQDQLPLLPQRAARGGSALRVTIKGVGHASHFIRMHRRRRQTSIDNLIDKVLVRQQDQAQRDSLASALQEPGAVGAASAVAGGALSGFEADLVPFLTDALDFKLNEQRAVLGDWSSVTTRKTAIQTVPSAEASKSKMPTKDMMKLVLTVALESVSYDRLMVLIDDADSVDSLSAQTLTSVLMSESAGAVTLVCVQRPAAEGLLTWQRQAAVQPTLLKLTRLSAPEIKELITRTRPGLSQRIKDCIAELSRGIPSHAVELCRSLADTDNEMLSNDAAMIIEHGVHARFDRLPNEHRALLKTAAVIGSVFPVGCLMSMVPRSISRRGMDALLNVLEELSEDWLDPVSDRMREVHHTDGRTEEDDGSLLYAFKSKQAHEICYSLNTHRNLNSLHLSAAQHYEKTYDEDLRRYFGVISYHYRQSGNDIIALKFDLYNFRLQIKIGAYPEAHRLIESLRQLQVHKDKKLEVVVEMRDTCYRQMRDIAEGNANEDFLTGPIAGQPFAAVIDMLKNGPSETAGLHSGVKHILQAVVAVEEELRALPEDPRTDSQIFQERQDEQAEQGGSSTQPSSSQQQLQQHLSPQQQSQPQQSPKKQSVAADGKEGKAGAPGKKKARSMACTIA